MSEWSEFQTKEKREVASAGQNTFFFSIPDGQLAEIISAEVVNKNRAWLGAALWTCDSGEPASSTDSIGIVNGVLLPDGLGNGSLLKQGKWTVKKAVVASILDCTLNDVLRLKLKLRYKDLR